MPRPKKEGATPKTRSRFGCWNCKQRKIKCGEERPCCKNCERQGEAQACDYSIRLNWDSGRGKQTSSFKIESPKSLPSTPSTLVFPSPDVFSSPSTPGTSKATLSMDLPKPKTRHMRSRSNLSLPASESWPLDPDLTRPQQIMGQMDDQMIIKQEITSAPSEARNQHLRQAWEYPSPSMSAPSPNFGNDVMISAPDSPGPIISPFPFKTMPSSYPSERLLSPNGDYLISADRTKRLRLAPTTTGAALSPMAAPSNQGFDQSNDFIPSSSPMSTVRSPNMGFLALYSPFNPPQTPGSTSACEEQTSQTRPIPNATTAPYQSSPGSRIASVPVSSLLSNEPLDQAESKPELQKRIPIRVIGDSTHYGYDGGAQDRDTPMNDDFGAIVGSPKVPQSHTFDQFGSEPSSRMELIAFERGGYYVEPVPINIPNSLNPLPEQLWKNMNLLYFHHFLNHTARILVPNDCPQNPYRTLLPSMAVRDEDLLNLLLAYSACHRARLLNHPEPANRIASWVADVFPRLSEVLSNPYLITIKTIATAIMLTSLEIISPGAFGVDIRWRIHLGFARDMILARNSTKKFPPIERDVSFLGRWFAYLDILGSISGPESPEPLSMSEYWPEANIDAEGEIDCLLGFTPRAMRLLSRVAQLIKKCQPLRLDENNEVRSDWMTPPELVLEAEDVLFALHNSRDGDFNPCRHSRQEIFQDDENSRMAAREIAATNELYHWAGIIQLLRRVLNRPPDSEDVREAISNVVTKLQDIRAGSSAEACLLFPMFTAGCEARDPQQKQSIMKRMNTVESVGMKQAIKARKLMDKAWQLDQPWESLVKEEFIG